MSVLDLPRRDPRALIDHSRLDGGHARPTVPHRGHVSPAAPRTQTTPFPPLDTRTCPLPPARRRDSGNAPAAVLLILLLLYITIWLGPAFLLSS